MKFETNSMDPITQPGPSVRDLPRQIAKMAGLGALAGTPIAMFFGWISGQSFHSMFEQPLLFVLYASAIGAIFSVVFYVTCGLPIPFMKPYLRGLPKLLSDAIKVATAMAGGSFGCVLSISLIQLWFKVQ